LEVAIQTGIVPYCFAELETLKPRAALVLPRALWSGGSGFAAQRGLWARSRPGALGGALVMPRKIWPGPVLPPPKFPGVAMESCLIPLRSPICPSPSPVRPLTTTPRRKNHPPHGDFILSIFSSFPATTPNVPSSTFGIDLGFNNT
jgi:hypothetical protein